MKINKMHTILKMQRKGQGTLAVPKEVIFGLASIVVGLIFVYIFVSQLFVAAPITAGSYEANASNVVRANFSGATTTFSGSFGTIATFAGLVVIIIMIALGWSYFSRSGINNGMGTY